MRRTHPSATVNHKCPFHRRRAPFFLGFSYPASDCVTYQRRQHDKRERVSDMSCAAQENSLCQWTSVCVWRMGGHDKDHGYGTNFRVAYMRDAFEVTIEINMIVR